MTIIKPENLEDHSGLSQIILQSGNVLNFRKEVLDNRIFFVGVYDKYDVIISYATARKDLEGSYSIEGGYSYFDTGHLSHKGVEVDGRFRWKGFGHYTLALLTSELIKDHENEDRVGGFLITAQGIRGKEHFYESFGFEIDERLVNLDSAVIEGHYRKLEIPNVNLDY